jgi:hypothetical protein
MTPEDRLRRAMEDHTSRVEPRPDGLARIEEKLMTEPTADTDTDRPSRRNFALAAGGLAAAVLLIVGFFALRGDDDGDPLDVAGDPTTTTEPEATDDTDTDTGDAEPDEGPDEGTTEAPTTTEPDTTTTETAPPPATPVDPATVLFPDPYTSQRFEDPASAGRAFATDVVGMQEPFSLDFQQGDARSGEVVIRPMENGPATTVLVRQMDDDSWYVIGAMSEEIILDEPENFTTAGNPVRVRGEGRAFEGTIPVRVLADQHGVVGEDFVTGGGGPEFGAFEGEIDIDLPDGAEYGIVLLITEGGEDFVPWTFTAVRVRFAP